MTFAASERIGISGQRSFWLRCFLGVAMVALLTGSAAQGQISILKPLHIQSVRGYVTDESGKAVSNATVQLLRDGKVVLGARADDEGWFQIDKASGPYLLSASVGVSEVGREIVVETDPLTMLGHKTLYVMIRTSGSCSDCSIQVFTSKKQFFETVWQNTGHHY
jgi:hypothetical protein